MFKIGLIKTVLVVVFMVLSAPGALFATDSEWTTEGSAVYKTDSAGNVGIGTSQPDEKLEVSGGIVATGVPRGAADADWGSLGTFPVYTMLTGKDQGHASALHGLGAVIASGLESPFFYGYEYPNNKMMFGSMSAADRNPATGFRPRVVFDLYNGYVGIGTASPDYMLTVNGSIKASEIRVLALNAEDLTVTGTLAARDVKVRSDTWSDFVFEPGYELPSLDRVEVFIKEKGHLPDMPSSRQISSEGLSISDMLALQMRKIEEITLYIIELKKENDAVRKENEALRSRFTEIGEPGDRFAGTELQ